MEMPETDKVKVAMVTGGAGFLGSHVCDRLISEGAHVICVDNLMTGRRANVAHLKAVSAFELIEADVSESLPQREVDEIWNLACAASPPNYQIDPVHTMLTNVVGMKHCLELALHTGAQVFQASTSEVYGDPEVHPQVESYRGHVNTTGPRACYDEGKRAAEALCYDYIRTYQLDVRVARIFNTYGPRMDPADGRVISNFIVKALLGEPLELYGDGSQTRSLCYVDDLVVGLFGLMRRPSPPPGPLNLGNSEEFTIRGLADLIIRQTQSPSEIVMRKLPADDPRQRCPDISLAKKLLGWEATVSLSRGLASTIEYFRNELWLTAPVTEVAQ